MANRFIKIFFVFSIFIVFFNNTLGTCLSVSDEIKKSFKSLDVINAPRNEVGRYFAFGNKNNPISFGFEVEFEMRQSPKLGEYYKLIGYSDRDWFNLPLQKRVELIQEKIKSKLIPRSKILQKTKMAPDFLADFAITAEGNNLELAANKITTDLNEIEEYVNWVQTNIGKGSLQGHAVFNIEKENSISGLFSEIKFQADIAQAESLEMSYLSSQKNGKVPAANFVHAYLPPMDYGALYLMEERLKKNAKLGKDIRSKRVYGTSYRPDLYGKKKVGFEVRNCHIRVDCLQKELREISMAIEKVNEAPALGLDQVGDMINSDLLNKVSQGHRIELLRLAEKVPGDMPLNSKASRFLYPLMEWENHPLILMLEKKKYEEFIGRLKIARTDFDLELKLFLFNDKISVEDKLNKLRELVAKFSKQVGMADYLKLGKVRGPEILSLVAKYDLPNPAIKILANTVDPESIAKLLKKIMEMAGPYNKERMAVFYSEMVANPEHLIDIYKKLDEEVLKVILKEMSAQQFVESLLSVSGEMKENFISMANYLAKENPDKLLTFLERVFVFKHSSQLNLKILNGISMLGAEKMATIISSPFFDLTLLSSSLSAESDYLKYFDLFSENPSAASKEWFWNNSRKKLKYNTRTYNNLVLRRTEKIESIDAARHLLTIDGKKYFIDVRDERLFKLEEVISVEKLKKYENERLQFLENSKKTVVIKENIEFDLRLKDSKDKIFLITNKIHSGLYYDGFVYEMVNSGFIRKIKYQDWILEWSPSSYSHFFAAEFKATPEQIKNFKQEIEKMMSTKHQFNLHATEITGDLNCALFASSVLNKSGVTKFSPVSFCSSSSASQAVYIANEAYKSDAVSAVYLKESSKDAVSSRRNLEIGIKIGAGVAATGGAGLIIYSLD